jgi:Fur family ferric uptake transcriptional regulator
VDAQGSTTAADIEVPGTDREEGGSGPAGPQMDDLSAIGRPTRQRTTVLHALVTADGFVSAQVLHATLLASGARVGLSTIYRTLTAFANAGRADTVRDQAGERLFRYRPGVDHLHYLICRTCGLSLPVDSSLVEGWADQVGTAVGFADVQHTIELTGTCTACQRSEASSTGEVPGCAL